MLNNEKAGATMFFVLALTSSTTTATTATATTATTTTQQAVEEEVWITIPSGCLGVKTNWANNSVINDPTERSGVNPIEENWS